MYFAGSKSVHFLAPDGLGIGGVSGIPRTIPGVSVMELVASRDGWDGFPVLVVDDAFNPFTNKLAFWEATTQYLFQVALVASGAVDCNGWRQQLAKVEARVAEGIERARNANATPILYGRNFFPEEHIGLVFSTLNQVEDCDGHAEHELYASLALWLLVESCRALEQQDLDWAQSMELQAAICLAHCFGEGGREVVRLEEKECRRKIATHATNMGRSAQKKRWENLIADFRTGTWKSKRIAAQELANRHSFGEGTVRKKLQGL